MMISIIIPVYNAQKTIAKCLDSILQNKYDDYEIILINDGSVDDSFQIMETYGIKYPDKIKIYNQENQGVAVARNRGIAYSQGKYVMFIDNDDWVDADYLQSFLTTIEKEESDVVIGGYRRTTDQKTLYQIVLQDTLWSRYMTMAPWAKIYRKDFLLINQLEFLENNIGEDVFFNLQAINLTDKISIISYCGYNWFYNNQSVSNSNQKSFKNKLNVMHLLNSCYDKLKEIGVVNKVEVEFYFIRYVVWYILFAGRKSNHNEIMSEFAITFQWLSEKYPEFQENKYIGLFEPKGETLKNKIAVFVFLLLHRSKMIKFFLKIYAGK